MTINRVVLGVRVLTAVGAASAQVTIDTDASTFIQATGAVAEPPIPNLGLVGRTGTVWTLGRLTYSVSTTDPDVALLFTDQNAVNPGNEVVMSSVENLDVRVDTPVYGFGYFFVEGTDVPGSCNTTCPCHDATFQVTLLLGATVVGSFTFNAPDDVLAFYGVRSVQAFDTVLFRDTSGGCDNEYWGRFYLADAFACVAGGGSGDGNADGGTDGGDIQGFVNVLLQGGPPSATYCAYDMNSDGVVNTVDLPLFVAALLGP